MNSHRNNFDLNLTGEIIGKHQGLESKITLEHVGTCLYLPHPVSCTALPKAKYITTGHLTSQKSGGSTGQEVWDIQ